MSRGVSRGVSRGYVQGCVQGVCVSRVCVRVFRGVCPVDVCVLLRGCVCRGVFRGEYKPSRLRGTPPLQIQVYAPSPSPMSKRNDITFPQLPLRAVITNELTIALSFH